MDVERTFEQWSTGNARIKWSAVFAGWAVGLAVQMVLILLGLGIGAWAIDIRDDHPASGIPIGAGIWTGLSMLMSAFIGGYITARMSGVSRRSDGLYHGIVVWGVNWLIFAWLTTTAMSAMIGGAFSMFGSALQTVGQGISGAASTAASKIEGTVSISTNDLRRQLESVLQATGKQELQPGQVQKDAEGVAGSARSGQPLNKVSESALSELQAKLSSLDREAAINIMVNKMGLSDQQAKQVVQSTIGVLAPLQDKARDVKQQSVELGAQALDRTGTIAMWLSLLALLTLGVSALGGLLGTPEDSMLEARSQAESFREIRRAS